MPPSHWFPEMGSYEAWCFDEVVALYVATKEDDGDEAPRGKHGAPQNLMSILMGAGRKEN